MLLVMGAALIFMAFMTYSLAVLGTLVAAILLAISKRAAGETPWPRRRDAS